MKILLDGKHVGDGSIEAEYEVAKEALGNDFDVSRLSYDPDDLRQAATDQAAAFATSVREQIVGEPDALRRDGWTMKIIARVAWLMVRKPEELEAFAQAAEAAYGAEAERRGLGESSEDVMRASDAQFFDMLLATAIVEGRHKETRVGINAAEADQLDGLLGSAKVKADADLALLAGGG